MTKQPTITQDQIKRRVDSTIFSRGQSYYKQGAVSHCIRRGPRIEARCQGSYPEPYHVWAEFDGNAIADAGCSCEYSFTWDGDCKHIIAVLLTYLHKPEKFDSRPTTHEALASRSREDLIEMIEQMVRLYPDLQRIVDRPTVGQVISGDAKLDEASLHRTLSAALEADNEWDDWGESAAAAAIDEIAAIGHDFAKKGDHHHALAVYCLILETCNAHDQPGGDPEAFVIAVNDMLEQMEETMDRAHLGDHATLRRRVLDALLGAFFWDLDEGGYGYGEGCDTLLLGIATPDDVPYLREQVDAAAADMDTSGYNQWRRKALEEFRIQLDLLDATDPEETIARLRQSGMVNHLVDMLLSQQRVDDAVNVIQTDIHELFPLINALNSLFSHGRQDAAIAIAEARLQDRYTPRILAWLVDALTQQRDNEKLFHWQLQRMQHEPSLLNYNALQATAVLLGNWSSVRPEIEAQLAKAEEYYVLTQVYLMEKAWDQAWKTLAKVQQSKDAAWYRTLAYEVAQKTRQASPERAIPIYMEAARDLINRRNRGSYAQAAELLVEVREMYRRMGDLPGWEELIAGLRAHLKSLRALQDELNKAGL